MANYGLKITLIEECSLLARDLFHHWSLAKQYARGARSRAVGLVCLGVDPRLAVYQLGNVG